MNNELKSVVFIFSDTFLAFREFIVSSLQLLLLFVAAVKDSP